MNKYRSLIFGLVILGAISGVVYLVVKNSAPPTNVAVDLSGIPVGSPVNFVEYGDFQCPACGAYYPLVKQALKAYGDKIKFTFKNFPLSQHKNADIASRAGESAREQGKFMEMYDMLYTNQEKWAESTTARDTFIGYAKTLNLDLTKFQKDIDSDAIESRVRNDYQEGVSLGVNSTPTFFVNGRQIQNPQSYDEFQRIFNKALGI